MRRRRCWSLEDLEVRSLLSGITYSLTTDQSSYQIGQPITMTFTETNTGDQPVTVGFRVFGTPGHFTVGDITVLGMDLAITEQDQFTSFLQEHNNDVKALTANLKERAANVRSSGKIGGGN